MDHYFCQHAIIAFSLAAIAADDDLPRNIELKPGAAPADTAGQTAADTSSGTTAPDRHRGKGRAEGGSRTRRRPGSTCGGSRGSTPSRQSRNRASAGTGSTTGSRRGRRSCTTATAAYWAQA